jgi:hypothetical protein
VESVPEISQVETSQGGRGHRTPQSSKKPVGSVVQLCSVVHT